ncbi:hypothetical protein ACIA5D_11400 [Actinoplanes sp. NPDC051513]|uniref:hypothetical protein n=1 Tax=Actinoplanes sp. NPDC051513 TaxID=3363908 RepID=UPI0037B8F742
MQRARRLASVAVVASLAVAGLSACRSEPSVAAYVGDTKITEDRVDAVYDEAQAAAVPAREGEAPAPALTRAEVARTLISTDVLGQVAKSHNVALPADLGLEQVSSDLRLPATTEYVRLYATAKTYVAALRQAAPTTGEPTEADLRQVFDVLVANGEADASQFEQFKSQLPAQNKQLVTNAATVRNEINEVAGPLKIRVNPRYQPAMISVLEFQTQNGAVRPLVTAPLGADDTVPVSAVS